MTSPDIDPKQCRLMCAWRKIKDDFRWSNTLSTLLSLIEILTSPAYPLFRELDQTVSVEYMLTESEGIRSQLTFILTCIWLFLVTESTLVVMMLYELIVHPLNVALWITTYFTPAHPKLSTLAFKKGTAHFRNNESSSAFQSVIFGICWLIRQAMYYIDYWPVAAISCRALSLIPVQTYIDLPWNDDVHPCQYLWRFLAKPFKCWAWHDRWQKSSIWCDNKIWEQPIECS